MNRESLTPFARHHLVRPLLVALHAVLRIALPHDRVDPRLVVLTAVLTVLAADNSAMLTRAADRPNIVLIMADDMGYGDLGFHGNPLIQTPNLDAMALRSARMTNFYVSPVCAPTRACLMTGRYNYRTRCIDTYIGRAMMDPAEVTVAELLREKGYATGIFGKWHLGDNYPLRAHDQGFDLALVHRGGGIGQPSDPPGAEGKYTDPILFRNGVPEQQTGYCTDVYYRNAFQFIEQSHEQLKPFFVYLPDNCPHGPFHDVPNGDLEAYRAVNLENDRFPQASGHKLPKKSDTDKRARIFSMVTNIDRNIGRLFQKLDELRIRENTLVVFMVDNGPNGRRYVAGMRGMKSHVHEGGIRAPFFVDWPARLNAGTESDRVAAHIDVLPTLLAAAEVNVPSQLKLDGRNLLPLLEGSAGDWTDREIVIQSHRGDVPVKFHHFMIRNQTWKLVHPSGFGKESFAGSPQFELYNLADDPLELHDVASQHPTELAALKSRYTTWFDDVSTTRSENFAPPRIHIGTAHENPTVLTRQDWRHTHDRPWSTNSRGHWLLYAAAQGNYDVECRFEEGEEGEQVQLRINDFSRTLNVGEGDSSVTFQNVPISDGDVQLEVTLVNGETSRGVHQVELLKR